MESKSTSITVPQHGKPQKLKYSRHAQEPEFLASAFSADSVIHLITFSFNP